MNGIQFVLALLMLVVSVAAAGVVGWATNRAGDMTRRRKVLTAAAVLVTGIVSGIALVELYILIGHQDFPQSAAE